MFNSDCAKMDEYLGKKPYIYGQFMKQLTQFTALSQ